MGKHKQTTFLKPRARSNDEFHVYDKGALTGTQFEHVECVGGRRVVKLDPEVIHRMASLGLSREMVANYYGISKAKFMDLADEYPEIEEHFLMGMSAGMVKSAMALEKQIEGGQCIPTIFRLKVGGWIEADKRKDNQESTAPQVTIYLPDNNRDRVIEGSLEEDE